ncbi:MAG: hypothetical protein VXW91_03675 [Pseudomonadota bacterium]|jgi:cytochrome bd-type quinol oxidase subunit 2|nr:hypothetical protein [Pseudomonadota bacterium]MEC8665791.1 hypothetical protein [Pseudomonadota bacterium]
MKALLVKWFIFSLAGLGLSSPAFITLMGSSEVQSSVFPMILAVLLIGYPVIALLGVLIAKRKNAQKCSFAFAFSPVVIGLASICSVNIKF